MGVKTASRGRILVLCLADDQQMIGRLAATGGLGWLLRKTTAARPRVTPVGPPRLNARVQGCRVATSRHARPNPSPMAP
jgi:hypothetical protein